MALLSTPLNFIRLTKTAEVARKGVATAGKSIQNISQIVLKRVKVKREIFTQTQTLKNRRVEVERRKQIEDEIESVDTLKTPKGPQSLAMADTSRGFFERIIGFVGYLTAGWLVNNLPTLIGMGKEFIARLQKAGELLSGFFNSTIKLFTNFGNVLGSLGQNIISFDFFDTSNRLTSSFDELNSTIAGLGAQIEEAFGLVTTPLTQGKYSGEDIPATGTQKQSEGAYETQTPSGGSAGGGQWKPLLDVISSGEGGYESVNPGQVVPGLTQMTIADAWATAQRVGKSKRGSGAMGRYQLLSDPIGRARKAGLDPYKDIFSPVNQDRIAVYILENIRYGKQWLAGTLKGGDSAFAQGIADEWAGVPNLFGRYSYPGQGGKVKAESVKSALQKVKRGSEVPSGQPSGSNLQPPVVNAGPVQSVTGTWETGKGFNPSGSKDVYGRPVVLSRSAAEAFSAMMRDSKGVVKGSDVSSSQRSLEKNRSLPGAAVKSKHLRGLALDIHGPSNAWMRKYGPRYGWYANDYSGSHGGHFEFRGGSSRQTPQSPEQISAPPQQQRQQKASSPAQISAPPQQQRASYAAGITPERKGQDIIIAQPSSQQNVIMSGGSEGGDLGSSQVSNFAMLNNFIKNKLLLDLAYL